MIGANSSSTQSYLIMHMAIYGGFPVAVERRTLTCDVSYIAGALGEDVFGEARVLRRGKEIIYSEVKALNSQGKLLATGNHIFHIGPSELPPPPPISPADNDPQIGNKLTGLGSLSSRNTQFVNANIAMLENMDGRMPYMAQIGWSFERGDSTPNYSRTHQGYVVT